MASGRIGFSDLALRDAMKTEEQVVETVAQIWIGSGDHRINIVRLVEIRGLHLDSHGGREPGGDFFDALDRAFIAGHGVMRKQRDQKKIVHTLLREPAHGIRDGWVLIAHRELHRDIDARLKLRLHIAAGNDQRRTGRCPDALVGVSGLLRARRQNGEMNNEEAGQPVHVQHAAVHQEFAQIAAHVGRRR